MDYISPNQILFNYSNCFDAYVVSLVYTFSNIEKTKKSPSEIWKENGMKLMGYISNNKAHIKQILTSF